MAHDHGDGQPQHSHGGSAAGLGWHLLDVLMLVCGVIVIGLWIEMLVRAHRQRKAERQGKPDVRADVAPAPMVNLEALADLAERDQAAAAERDAAEVLAEANGTDWLRRRAQDSK